MPDQHYLAIYLRLSRYSYVEGISSWLFTFTGANGCDDSKFPTLLHR